MSTPFLYQFATSLVRRLIAEEKLEINKGSEDRICVFVCNYLGTKGRGGRVVEEVERALFRCDEVIELYASPKEISAVMEDLHR